MRNIFLNQNDQKVVQKFPMSLLNAPQDLPLGGDGEHKLGLCTERFSSLFFFQTIGYGIIFPTSLR